MIRLLKRWLGLDWFTGVDHALDQLEAAHADMAQHLLALERWVNNLDSALWRVDQAMQQGAKTGAPVSAPVTDLKELAGKIKSEMTLAKAKFPTKLEDLR